MYVTLKRLNNNLLLVLQDDDEEQRLWRGLCLDRMVRAVESSLVVLFILTSPSMPKQLYLEEVIDRVIFLTKYQLKNNIFPEYDPLYKESDPNGKILLWQTFVDSPSVNDAFIYLYVNIQMYIVHKRTVYMH